MSMDKVREVIAGTLADEAGFGRTYSQDVADAAITAIHAAGYAVVPREATPQMMRAFWLAGPYPAKPFLDGYRAMIAAAEATP